jgi:hypothetical protein
LPLAKATSSGRISEARHVPRALGEEGCHVARAGADLEHPLVLLQGELLQQPRLDLRRKHGLTAGQRHLGVDEGQTGAARGHEILALDDGEDREHVLIQHLPGADLLLDHVEAGLLDVHPGILGCEALPSVAPSDHPHPWICCSSRPPSWGSSRA